ncbi:Crp/Fnr family transcriptional regulator [Myxosarcina sp. GI1]|uniref:Crp/Fnr family transcriptional regulator n=1 Tax=Myxosarcina sp. GI1 TaxID=1541065 RepID=UPI000907C921|nr:Crp/Fnr family transcriptional regulator [Myxosarcina sp. GI1]
MTQGEILHLAGERINEVYFPIDCLLSMTITMSDGRTIETGLAGNRDVLGVNGFMSSTETNQTEYIVQISGRAFKTSAQIMRSMFLKNLELRTLMLCHTQVLIAQLAQTVACNGLHSLEQRMSRWLLEARERTSFNKLYLTHEFISNMLGVRRAGVTQCAKQFQNRGIIQYSRGHIEIIDRQGLEDSACECFWVVKQESDRLLGISDRLTANDR